MNQEKQYTFLLTPQGNVLTDSPVSDSLFPGVTIIEIQADEHWTIIGHYRKQYLTAVSLRKQNCNPKE